MNVKGCSVQSEFEAELERLQTLAVEVMLRDKNSRKVITGKRASHADLDELFNKFNVVPTRRK